MRKLIIVICIMHFTNSLLCQEKYSIYGGDDCAFDYLIYSPSGKKGDTNPKIIQLCDYQEDLYESFQADSLRKLPELRNYDFFYIPNNREDKAQRLDCLGKVQHMATFSTNIASKNFLEKNIFLFVNDQAITSTELSSSNLKEIYTDVILVSHFIKPDDPQTENINIDTEILINAFKGEAEDKKTYSNYNGTASNFNFTLSGILKDSETGESLPFANIIIQGTSNGATTNMDGYFTLHNVPSDTSTLVTSYLGYKKTEINLNPYLSKTNLLIEITPSSLSLNEIVITAQTEDIFQISTENISTIKMTPKKLNQLPNIGEQDLMRVFQLMPGISASNESSSGMYIRGGTPDQNLIAFDGFTIYHVDHLYGFFSAFNSNAVKDVQLYKGGYESRFGGRLSSVTEITGKDGNKNNFNIGGSISLLNINAYAEVPINEKFTSIVALRRSYKGLIYNNISDQFTEDHETTEIQERLSNRFATTVNSYFYDLNGKFTYRPTDKDIISLSIFNGTDNLDNGYKLNIPQRLVDLGIDINLNISDLTNYGNFGTGIKWSRKWSPKMYGNTVISYSNYYSDREFGRFGTITREDESQDISGGFSEDNNLKDYSFKTDYQFDLTQSLQLRFGAFGTSHNIKYDYFQNDTTAIIQKNDNGNIFGGYLQTNFRLFSNKLKIVPGVRITSYNITNKLYYEPRFNANYIFSDKLKLAIGWGQYYQFANQITRQDLSSGSKDFWVLSNGNDIPVSSSEHNIAGLSYETSKYLFSVEGYYKNLTGLSEFTQYVQSSPQGLSYKENFFSGDGYAKGFEFLIQKKGGSYNGWVSYTLGEVKNKFDVYGSDYFSANQDVKHEFKWVGIYNYKRWEFSGTWIYATGRPFTAPAGAYSLSLLNGSNQDYFTVTDKNSLRLINYHRLDLAANYKLYRNSANWDEQTEIGYIGFSIFNVYNQTNNWYNQYEVIEGEIIETNINYLGFMPNITLSLKLR